MAEEYSSKRERQKARKQAKREEEQRQAKQARVRRLGVLSVVVLAILGLAGVLVGQAIADRREAAQREEQVAARLDELGCTEIEELPELSRAHINSAEELAGSPPEELYGEQRPATSGVHMGQVALTGAYDTEIDERLLLHNLEHGYVVAWYDDEADQAQVDELLAWAEERIDGDYPKLIAAKYHEQIPLDGNFAFVAWDHRQTCEQFDADVAQVFLDDRHDASTVPEPRVPPHTSPDQQGVIDPAAEDGPLLFPPLGEAAEVGEPPAMDDPAEPGEEPTELPEGDGS